MGAGAADVMLILRDVGKMREIGIGPDDLVGAAARQGVQDRLKILTGILVLIAVEADRGLADALDHLEDRIALLLADRVAEESPEQADIVAKRKILFRRHIGIDQGHVLGSASGVHAAPAK